MIKRNVLSSPRLAELKKRRRKAVLNKFLISVFGIVAVFALLAYASRVKSLNISDVLITGNNTVYAKDINDVVRNEISGKYLWLFPKSNILFYPENAIKNTLKNNLKRLKDVNLSVRDNQTLIVSVAERIPKYTWCGAALPEAGSNIQTCYFLDENGYVFDEAPYFSGDVYVKFYGKDGLDADNPAGSYFYKENFTQIVSFKDTLVNMGLKPVALYITDDGDIRVFLSGGTSGAMGPEIILKTDADFQNVAENLQAALDTEPLKSEFKNKYSKLEYIDLRFGNKVYDKFRND